MKSRVQRQLDPLFGVSPLQEHIREELAMKRDAHSKFIPEGKVTENRMGIHQKRKNLFATDTTQSRHRMKRSTSMILDLQPQNPVHIIVADIAYIRLRKGFAYLAIVTDLHTGKIIGFDLSMSLAVAGCIRALKMALAVIPKTDPIIHHSDRGIQYRSRKYVEIIEGEGNGATSTTPDGNAYENALAEHVNNALKRECSLHRKFESFRQAKTVVTKAIWMYNEYHPHKSEGKDNETEKNSENGQAA